MHKMMQRYNKKNKRPKQLSFFYPAGDTTALAGRKIGINREKGRMSVGEGTYPFGSQRAAKTFTAAAVNIRSGRRECFCRPL
jgi:hypothetical protein